MKWNKIFTYYIMPGLSGFLSIGGALPFSNFLTGGATSTLTLPSSSSSSKKRKNTRRQTKRRTARRKTSRRQTTRRTSRTQTSRRTSRRQTARRQTSRRTSRRQTSRRTNRKVVEPRKLTQRKRMGKPGKYVCINGCDKKVKAYYTGKEPSPKGLGYCARCTPLNIVMRGKDGNLWENKKFSKGKRWVKV